MSPPELAERDARAAAGPTSGASPTSSEVPARTAGATGEPDAARRTPLRRAARRRPRGFTGPGWLRVGLADDVPMQEGRTVRLGGRLVAVFRLPDGFAAVDGACPHLGGPLQDGIVAERCVTCPLHGRRFDLDTGARLDAEDADGLVMHEVAERGGELWVRLGPGPVADVALDGAAAPGARAAAPPPAAARRRAGASPGPGPRRP